MKLANKVAIVVGGAQGIGRAIANTFLEEGAKIALVDRIKPNLDEVVQEIRGKGGKAIAIVADVTDEKEVNGMVEETVRQYGKIDILVNSAGFTGPTVRLHELEQKDWDEIFAVNLKAPFLCSKAVLKQMLKQRSGNIISLSGTAGKEGLALRGALTAAKWGLLGLTQVIAKEFGPFGIRANVLCPGGVYGGRLNHVFEERGEALGLTPAEVEKGFLDETPLGRFAYPEEVARAVVFLASDDSCLVTGEALNFSGGAIMH